MNCQSSTWRRKGVISLLLASLIGLVLLTRVHAQTGAQAPAQTQSLRRGAMPADHYLPAKPENVTWGWIPIDAKPAVTIKSGETVRIDTISHQGATQAEDPVTFLAKLGVKPEEVLQDARDFWASRASRPRTQGRTGAHILTGPVAVTGAEPGDTLEIQILELSPRVPWGINTAGATSGVFAADYPGTKPGDPGSGAAAQVPASLIRTAVVNGREVALFSDTIHVPLTPFMGTMAVAPAQSAGRPARRHHRRLAELQAARSLRRQSGQQGAGGRNQPVPAGFPAGRAVLHR